MKKKMRRVVCIFMIICSCLVVQAGCSKQYRPIGTTTPEAVLEIQPVDINNLEKIGFSIEGNEYWLGMKLSEMLKTSKIIDKDNAYSNKMEPRAKTALVLKCGKEKFDVVVVNSSDTAVPVGDCVVLKVLFDESQTSDANNILFFNNGLSFGGTIADWEKCIGKCESPKSWTTYNDYVWVFENEASSLLINVYTDVGQTKVTKVLMINYIYM